MNRKIILFLCVALLGGALVSMPAPAFPAVDIVDTILLDNGETLVMQSLGALVDLGNACDYDWWYGCSPTSAGMAMGFYDRNGYNGMNYGRLVPGGEAETSSFGASAPLGSAAIASSGHITDFYGGESPGDGYGKSGDDLDPPWHSFDCMADFMGTSQDAYDNSNGSSTLWYYGSGAPLTVEEMYAAGPSFYENSLMYGIYEYLDYHDYGSGDPSDYTLFNQLIYGYGGNTQGFTWDDYMAEIDAGRPVLIHNPGHSMCGIGYDTGADGTSQIVRLYDTWSGGPHDMTWGGTYGGATHHLVTAFILPDGDSDRAEDADGGSAHLEYYYDGFSGDTTGLPADYSALDGSWEAYEFDGGTDGWLSLLFYYDEADLASKGITDEEWLRAFWWNAGESQWYAGGIGAFFSGAPQGILGDYGVDTINNYVWANINHASTWSLAGGNSVPEPASLLLFSTGILGLLSLVKKERT